MTFKVKKCADYERKFWAKHGPLSGAASDDGALSRYNDSVRRRITTVGGSQSKQCSAHILIRAVAVIVLRQ